MSFQPSSHALEFRGGAQAGYVKVPHHDSLVPKDELTVAAWILVQPSLPVAGATIVASEAFSLSVAPSPLGTHAVLSATFDAAGGVLTGGLIPFGCWTLVSATWRASKTLKIRVDGVDVGSSVAASLPEVKDHSVYFGISPVDRSTPMLGMIGPVYMASSKHEYMGYWANDAEHGHDVADSSGRGNNGRIEGWGVEYKDAPKVTVLSFDGNGRGYVRIAPPSGATTILPANLTSLTISAWVYLMNDAPQNMKLVSDNTGFCLGVGQGFKPGTLCIYPEFHAGGDSNSSIQAGAVPYGKWTLLTTQWTQLSATSGEMQAWINGETAAQPVTTGPLQDNGGNVYFGVAGWNAPGGVFPYWGLMRSVRMSGIVNDGSNATNVEIGFWPMNEGKDHTVHDLSGNHLDGTIVGSGVDWNQPLCSAALGLDGSGSGVVTLPWVTTPIDFSESPTVSVWLKLPPAVAGQSYTMTVLDAQAFTLTVNYPLKGGAYFTVTCNLVGAQPVSVGGPIAWGAPASTIFALNQWVLLSFGWSNSQLTAWCDNIQIQQLASSTGSLMANQSIVIGGALGGTSPYQGLLGALTIVSSSGTLASWSIDEGSGRTLHESIRNANGTIVGTAGVQWMVYPARPRHSAS